jgi:3-methyl-2-oxobutanoate hydroxymethyltransferase
MLGLNVEFHPRFVRHYSKLAAAINSAVKKYIEDIRGKDFPNKNESY